MGCPSGRGPRGGDERGKKKTKKGRKREKMNGPQQRAKGEENEGEEVQERQLTMKRRKGLEPGKGVYVHHLHCSVFDFRWPFALAVRLLHFG